VTLILASASPRRQALLRQAGYDFVVRPAQIDEENFLDKKIRPIELARFLANVKAERVAEQFDQDVTLAADTIVAFGDLALGKPATAGEARQMIRLLSGTTQVVITAIAVACPARQFKADACAMSLVRMHRLTPADVEQYIESGLWEGKAGGYGIQDPNPIVTCTAGEIDTVIGLPMKQTKDLLNRAGVTPTSAG
jgi:septum formation protein